MNGLTKGFLGWTTLVLLSACGGGGGSDNQPPQQPPPPPAATTFTVGGTVAGLSGTVVLQNNLRDNLSVTSNAFTFATTLDNNSAYLVSVLTQPQGQTCTVADGSGTSATNVTNVSVTCAAYPATVSIGGTISGLNGGESVTLRNTDTNNGATTSEDHAFTANGAFSFPTKIPSGSLFLVSALSSPNGRTCSVFNGGGVPPNDINYVNVVCEDGTQTHTVGGSVTGLTKTGLVLAINANNPAIGVAPPASPGPKTFGFPNGLTVDTEYSVGIVRQPTDQTCIVTNGKNRIGSSNIANVTVTCIDNTTDPLVGTYAISNTAGHADYITFFADGTYAMATVENDQANCGTSKGNGVELGAYRYTKTTNAFSIVSNLLDTNGGCGVWDNGSGANGTLTKTGVGQSAKLQYSDSSSNATLTPVASIANTIVGSFGVAPLLERDFIVFGNDGHYVVAQVTGPTPGVEYGCYTQTTATITPNISAASCPVAVDTNTDAGLSDASGTAIPYSIPNPYLILAGDGTTGLLRIVPN